MGQTLVTVAMKSIEFHQPVWVGDIVSFLTHVVRIGRTSLTVDVEALRFDFINGKWERVCSTQIIYVKIDEQGRPTPLDPCVATGCPLGEPLPRP